jgi:hypothetical protein
MFMAVFMLLKTNKHLTTTALVSFLLVLEAIQTLQT